MPKPANPKMQEIAIKYQTGQYGINELARIYKIDKATISRYIKSHGIKINQHAKEAIETLSYGYSSLQKVLETDGINQQNKTTDNDKSTNPNVSVTTEQQSMELANEIIEIVKQKNPQFAKGFHALSALMIRRSSEILQKDDISSSDIANISKAVSNMNDTLGVFPKMPTIAQQINIGGKESKNQSKNKNIEVSIEFIDKKEMK